MAGTVLVLREHESVRIGNRWDTRARTVPERVASEIERLQAGSRVGYFTVGRHALRATSFVGTVGFDDGALDVLPKVDGAGNAETRSRLLEMLSFAGLVPHAEGSVTGLGRVPSTLLDAFLARYVRGLALEWRRGRIRSYVRVDRDRPALRGKFLFAAQLRRNVLRPERFHTRADEFIEDIPVSRLLKAGLEVCRHYAISEEPRREAAELLVEFEQVSGVGLSPEEVARVTVDRRSERFAPLVELARLLVARASPWEPGRPRTYALLFDMDVVFYDPYQPNGYQFAIGVRRADTLAELMGQCDFVSIHTPLTAETPPARTSLRIPGCSTAAPGFPCTLEEFAVAIRNALDRDCIE